MKRAILATWLLSLILAAPVAADTRWPDQGWQVKLTTLAYDGLLEALREAGPTEAAANRGVTIPGNRVVGVFRNDYAVRILRLSVPAMIEAPMRFYVTENDDGSATLSWKTPSHLLAPYAEEAGEELETVARELDTLFATIAQRATEAAE